MFPAWLRLHHTIYPGRPQYTLEDIYSSKVNVDEDFIGLLTDPYLYDDVAPVEGSVVGIRQLRGMGHRIVFASSCVKGMMDGKWTWLQKHGFLKDGYRQDSDLISIHDKSLLRGQVLVDDAPWNLSGFDGHRILYDAPWNQKEGTHNMVRVKHWYEVVSLIERVSNGY